MEILRIDGLTKRYGAFTAVDGITLSVRAGEICGFLGPNGAGKTTTFRMIAGLLQPDGGAIHINGRDLAAEPEACKRDTGYVPDRPWLYEKLTGMEFLQFIASLYSMDEDRFASSAAGLLQLFDLEEWRDHLIESYSHGMRQKLIMTSVLMLDQPLLVIDEPMVGLDPKSARLVKELFKQKARNGTAVFLSTHSLEIAEELCHRIIIITDGAVRAAGTVEMLRAEAGKSDSGLEDIFLELTGAWELQQVIAALRNRQ